MKKSEIKFGLDKHTVVAIGTGPVNNVFPINKFEYMATTRTGLYKFERNTIKKSYHYPFSCSVHIEEYDLIAGVSAVGSELAIYDMLDLSQPLVEHIRTDQIAVFHLLYSPKSHSIICFGTGIEVYTLSFVRPRHISMAKPEISVTRRSSFATQFEASIMNAPCFDFEAEMIYIPGKKGFQKFDLDGAAGPLVSKAAATNSTCGDVYQKNKRFITAQGTDGIFMWEKMGSLEQKFAGSSSAILALRFVTKEFVIFLDANLNIFILDIKTNKCTVCLTLSKKPSKFIVAQQRLILCDGPEVTIFEIVLPFTLWAGKTTQPLKLRRCPKTDCAARIVAFCSNRMFHIFSPQTRERITHAVVAEQSIPFEFFYDRGLARISAGQKMVWTDEGLENHDVLFTMTAGGPTCVFMTGQNPCARQTIIHESVTSIVLCPLKGQWCYCMANDLGELLFYDYRTFERAGRCLVQKKKIVSVHYHSASSSVVAVFENEVVRFDLERQAAAGRVFITGKPIAELYGNTLFLGCKDGTIKTVDIPGMSLHDEGGRAFHAKEITDMSFHDEFFVTVSTDQFLKVWDYDLSEICRVWMPYQLSACEILNGKRDVLVGTDSDIVVVDGRMLFDSQDEENTELDNFDKLEDELVIETRALQRKRIEELMNLDTEKEKRPQMPSSEIAATRTPLRRHQNAKSSVYTKHPPPLVDAKKTMTAEDKRRIIAEMAKITAGVSLLPASVHSEPTPKPATLEEREEPAAVIPDGIPEANNPADREEREKIVRTPSSKEVLAALRDGIHSRRARHQDSANRRVRRKARKKCETVGDEPPAVTTVESSQDPLPETQNCEPEDASIDTNSSPEPVSTPLDETSAIAERVENLEDFRIPEPEVPEAKPATCNDSCHDLQPLSADVDPNGETRSDASQVSPLKSPDTLVHPPSVQPPEVPTKTSPRNKKAAPLQVETVETNTPALVVKRLSRSNKSKGVVSSQKDMPPLSLLEVTQQKPTCVQPVVASGPHCLDVTPASSRRYASPPARRMNNPLPDIA